MNTGVISIRTSAIKFFLALIAREFGPWLVQMYKTNVSLETRLVSKNPIAMFTSVLQPLVDTLYVLFQIRRFCRGEVAKSTGKSQSLMCDFHVSLQSHNPWRFVRTNLTL